MGTSLYQIGNHKICFKNRDFNDLVTEIIKTLDNTAFPNAQFLRHEALADSNPKNVRKIREIKTKHHWTLKEIKDKLKKLYFRDEVLLHKSIENKMHFYHLATIDGLLCIHRGITGGEENLNIILDKYAPFTYDTFKQQIEKDGYAVQTGICLIIKLYGYKNLDSWIEPIVEFETEILWNGLGKRCGSVFSERKREVWFFTVDEKLALNLLLQLGKKYNAKGKIKVYKGEGDTTLIYSQ